MNNKKHAYTLAEIMVVLLVLTIIFAAFAPIFTKRRIKESSGDIWSYYDIVDYDAYSYPGNPDYTGEFFIGVTPEGSDDIETTFAPLSKLVIRSSEEATSSALKQRQIQFRFSREDTTDAGDFAGTWFMDGQNVLLGGGYKSIIGRNDVSGGDFAKNNTSIGYDALTNITSAKNNTAIGYMALNKVTSGYSNTAIGAYADNTTTTGFGNTVIGYASYASGNTSSYANTIIGANSYVSSESSNPAYYNILIGYNTHFSSSSNSHNFNTAIGTKALENLAFGEYNIAIGYNALKKLTTGSYNVAIGYNACSEVTAASYLTCIGYNSGPHLGTTAYNYITNNSGDNYYNSSSLENEDDDDEGTPPAQRTYIGSRPSNYGGDAVLEIHNMNNYNLNPDILNDTSTSMKTSSTTTVINGNLIVKGRPYFTVNGYLYHFHDLVYPTEETDNTPGNRIYGYHNSTSDSYYALCAKNQNNYNFISGSGCVSLEPSSLSDRRLKDIGSKNNAGLAELRKLKVYNYTFKGDAEKRPHTGVIAQELINIFPNSVIKGSDGYLRISWDEMFYAAINAVKELDKKLAALVRRISDADKQITKLEQENAVLKTAIAELTTRVNKLKAQ